MDTRKMMQVNAVPATALTNGGTAVGQWIDIGSAKSSMSLILNQASGGSCTSLTVTYEVGYVKPGQEKVAIFEYKDHATMSPLQNMTPDDDGAITELTTVDLSSNLRIHDVLTLPPVRWVRFTITCNNNSCTADLIALYQV